MAVKGFETLMLDSDAQLMLGVRQGEGVCLDVLLRRHRGSIVQYLYRMVQNRDIAEELAQEVFLRVYRSRARYEATGKFTTWLYRIATNLALNWVRDRRHERNQESLDAIPERGAPTQVADPLPTADQSIFKQAVLAEVRRAVAALPDRQRAAVLMHKYDEMDYVEIARALGCSIPAVKSLLNRAYTTLRERLTHLPAV